MLMRRIVLIVLLVGLLSVHAVAEFDYGSYRPSSLAQVQTDQKKTQSSKWNITASAEFKYRIRLLFHGDHRPIELTKKELLARWVKALRLEPTVTNLFQHEIRVSEGDVVYWLPIQETLLEPLKDAVGRNAECDFFVTWIGSTRTTFVFLVNEFEPQNAGE
jgi:hypothetical protein